MTVSSYPIGGGTKVRVGLEMPEASEGRAEANWKRLLKIANSSLMLQSYTQYSRVQKPKLAPINMGVMKIPMK